MFPVCLPRFAPCFPLLLPTNARFPPCFAPCFCFASRHASSPQRFHSCRHGLAPVILLSPLPLAGHVPATAVARAPLRVASSARLRMTDATDGLNRPRPWEAGTPGIPAVNEPVRLFERAQATRPLLAPYVWAATVTAFPPASQTASGTVRGEQDAHETAVVRLSHPRTKFSASTGNGPMAVRALPTTYATSAQDVGRSRTALRLVLEQRKSRALSPYHSGAWLRLLSKSGLLQKYPNIPSQILHGFDFGIPKITRTFSPPNKRTIDINFTEFKRIVDHEFAKGRYIGPLSATEIEDLVGPFQSSPLSLVPKAGKPDRLRPVQNLSFPHTPALFTSSINCAIDSDMYPCTWGTFSAFCLTVWRLPPGAQGAVRDVAEAYRTIGVVSSQWAGLVVRINSELLAIDTAPCFGLASAAGVYGSIADAGADLFRASGIGPLSKWVDDHVFIRILCCHLDEYNAQRRLAAAEITANGGRIQTGGPYWYNAGTMPDGRVRECDEDHSFALQDLSSSSPRSVRILRCFRIRANQHSLFFHTSIFSGPSKMRASATTSTTLTASLGPLESRGSSQRTCPSARMSASRVSSSISPRDEFPFPFPKRRSTWRPLMSGFPSQPTPWTMSVGFMESSYTPAWYNLQGELTSPGWRPCSDFTTIVLSSRSPLPESSAGISAGGGSFSKSQTFRGPFLVHMSFLTSAPSPMPVPRSESVSQLGTVGELGGSFRAGSLTTGTLDGWKPSDSSSSSAPSLHPALLAATSRFSGTTRVLSRDGGQAGAATILPTIFSSASTSSSVMQISRYTQDMFPAKLTLPTVPHGAYSPPNPVSFRPFASLPKSSVSSSISTPTSQLLSSVFREQAEHRRLSQNRLSSSTQTTPSSSVSSNLQVSASSPRKTGGNATTGNIRFSAPLPSDHSPSKRRRAQYPLNLTPIPSALRPPCLANERLRLWVPLAARNTLDAQGHPTNLTADELSRIKDILVHTWAVGTRDSYGSGLLVYHVWNDTRATPEAQRAPASPAVLAAWLSSLAGSYAGGTVATYFYGVRAWHILHGIAWNINQIEIEALLSAATRLSPPKSKKRLPYTVDIISTILRHLDISIPLHAAVFSCLTTTFYSVGRVGEFTLRTLNAFDPKTI